MTQRFTKIDKAALTTIQAAALKALEAVGEQFGVTITTGGGSMAGQSGSLTFNLALPTSDGEAQTADEVAFKRYAEAFGLSKADLHETFSARGSTYRIIGLQPTRKKYSVLCTKSGAAKPILLSHIEVAEYLRVKRILAKAA